MTEREKFEAWVRSEDPTAPLHRRDMEGSERFGEYCAHWIDEQWTAWQASRRAALEEAEKVCDDIEVDRWSLYKGRKPYTGREDGRANSYVEGESDGACKCATAIRQLAEGETE